MKLRAYFLREIEQCFRNQLERSDVDRKRQSGLGTPLDLGTRWSNGAVGKQEICTDYRRVRGIMTKLRFEKSMDRIRRAVKVKNQVETSPLHCWSQ